MHLHNGRKSAWNFRGNIWRKRRRGLPAEKVVGIVPQLGNGLLDVFQGQMAADLGEAVGDVRGPAFGEFLEGADIKVAVMKIALQLRHEAGKKTPIVAYGVAAERRHPLRNPLPQEGQGLCLHIRIGMAA